MIICRGKYVFKLRHFLEVSSKFLSRNPQKLLKIRITLKLVYKQRIHIIVYIMNNLKIPNAYKNSTYEHTDKHTHII